MAYAFSASQREKTRRIALPGKMYAVLSWFGLNGGATHFDSLKKIVLRDILRFDRN